MSGNDYSILKWGVAGCGRIANDFVNAVQSEPSPQVHRFVAAASRSLESAKSFAEQHKIDRYFGSYRELAQDDEVHVVYIGNWNMDHFHTAVLFLQHGKHVLVEKPLTMNAKQTRALVSLARENNLFLMEALWSRFTPAYKFVFHQIGSAALGQVMHVGVDIGVPIAQLPQIARKDTGGGAILNVGCYPLNLVLQAFDNQEPEEIRAIGELNQNGIDKAVVVALKFANGGTASISMDVRVDLSNQARITGTAGCVQLTDPFFCPELIIINGQEHRFELPATNGHKNYGSSSGLRYQAHEVRRCLLENLRESNIMPLKHSILLATIEDEIRRQLGIVFEQD